MRTTESTAELRTKKSCGIAIADLQNWTSAILQLSVIVDIISLSICLCIHLSVCLSACRSVCRPACLSICLPVCLPACLSACLSVFPPVSLSVRLPASLSVYLSACVSVYLSVCMSVRRPACLSVPACLPAYKKKRRLPDQQPYPSINITNTRFWNCGIAVADQYSLKSCGSGSFKLRNCDF